MADIQQAQNAAEAAEKIAENIPESLPTTMPTTDDAMGALHRLKEIIAQTFTGHQQAWPDQLKLLADMHFIEATLLVVFGLACLIWGWKIFKPFVVINFTLTGAALGGMVAIWLEQEQYWYVGSAIGAVVLGVLAWPLFKAFVAFIGMMFGAMIGNALFIEIVCRCGRDDLAQYPWLGAVIGAIVFGVMAISFIRPTVILLTSLQGAMMFSAGVFALACKSDSLRPELLEKFSASPLIAHIVIAVLTVIGILLQIKFKSSATAGDESKKEE